MVRQNLLSAGHARVIAGLEDPAAQLALAKETLEKGYSVRELEAVAAGRRQQPTPPAKPKPHSLAPELKEMESRLQETFGMKAALSGTEKKGRIVLQYRSREELEHLYELINKLGE